MKTRKQFMVAPKGHVRLKHIDTQGGARSAHKRAALKETAKQRAAPEAREVVSRQG